MMAKLILSSASYEGLKNVKRNKSQTKPGHEELVKEANIQIEKNRSRYATAYKNARSYLG